MRLEGQNRAGDDKHPCTPLSNAPRAYTYPELDQCLKTRGICQKCLGMDGDNFRGIQLGFDTAVMDPL